MDYIDLRPDDVRLVEALGDDGRWHPGELLAYRRQDGVTIGWVRWTAGVGATHVGWLPEDRVRGPR